MRSEDEVRVASLRRIHAQDQKAAAEANERLLSDACRAREDRLRFERRQWRLKVLGFLAAVAAWTLLFTAFVVAFSGCSTGMIRVEAIQDSVERICDRHDSYVQQDGELDDVQRESQLLTSHLLRQVIAEAAKDPDVVETEDQRLGGPYLCDYPGPGECGCIPEQGTCTAPCSGCCPSKGCLANCPDKPAKEPQ